MACQAVARNASEGWWAHKGSNLGPLPCEGNALPLSYAPGRPWTRPEGCDLRSGGWGCQAEYAHHRPRERDRPRALSSVMAGSSPAMTDGVLDCFVALLLAMTVVASPASSRA